MRSFFSAAAGAAAARFAVALIALVAGGAPAPIEAAPKLRVVASSLDMADFASRIGGDRVEVQAIFRGRSDMHFFEPIPSHIVMLRKADALVVVGLDADAWIKGLIDAARNPRIRFGAPGYIDPSDGVSAIDVPAGRIDGSRGDVHPYGNPHYWYTPEHVAIAANNICEGFSRISPRDEVYFRKNRDELLEEAARVYAELRAKLAPYAGTGVIEYHASWDYFCRTFGLEIVATLEPKPGIPPSAKHLGEVVRLARERGAKLMLVEPYYPDKPVRYVARETGIEAVRIPLFLGTQDGIRSHLDLMRHNVGAIADALSRRN